ncbi:MAG: UDP-N-acetylmuramyl-tripeptide synthetase [Sphaerochaetaceae bacterium]
MRKLHELLQACALNTEGIPDCTIEGLAYDGRNCKPGYIFFAFEGLHSQGTDHIGQAISNGAVVIVTERKIPEHVHTISYVVSENSRSLFAKMCAAFYDYPSRKLTIIGVTGTDGKSTTCDYLQQLLAKKGIRSGLLGTVYMDDGSSKQFSPYRQSTPEADQMQQFLSRCVSNGLTYVVLECTSHALSRQYDRLNSIEYDIAIVTNVTSEHLEFHKSIEAYVDAKCNLVRHLKKGGVFISTTDNWHLQEFLSVLPKDCTSLILHTDLEATISFCDDGRTLQVLSGDKYYPINVLLPVLASNALLATLACGAICDCPVSSLLPYLGTLSPVEGRMHEIPNRLGRRILIDFAHTADAYQQLMGPLSGKGRMLALFGCAGERDTSKRKPMGMIASRYCDILVLTDEDPRFEDPQKINQDLISGLSRNIPIYQVPSRKEAIHTLFSLSRQGDILLFLGKGHEHTIEKQGVKYPWNETQEVLSAMKEFEQCK